MESQGGGEAGEDVFARDVPVQALEEPGQGGQRRGKAAEPGAGERRAAVEPIPEAVGQDGGGTGGNDTITDGNVHGGGHKAAPIRCQNKCLALSNRHSGQAPLIPVILVV